MAWSSYNQPALQALICGGKVPQPTAKDAVAWAYFCDGKSNPVLDELGERAVFVSTRDVADVLGISPETFRGWGYRLPLRLKGLPPLPQTQLRSGSGRQKERFFKVKEILPWIEKVKEVSYGARF